MARSSHIWILFRDGYAIEAFTVKHELISFIKPIIKASAIASSDYDDFFYDYEVRRFKDGGNAAGGERVDIWKLTEMDKDWWIDG